MQRRVARPLAHWPLPLLGMRLQAELPSAANERQNRGCTPAAPLEGPPPIFLVSVVFLGFITIWVYAASGRGHIGHLPEYRERD